MRFRIRPLEERIAYDAAFAADVADHSGFDGGLGDSLVPITDTHTAGDSGAASTEASETSDTTAAELQSTVGAGLRVLVVSSQVTDAGLLGDAALDGVEVVYYDAENTSLDGLLQSITQTLDGRQADSIGFVNHGVEGAFQLTESIGVSETSLADNAALGAFWNSIGDTIADGGRIDLLACDLAGNDAGLRVLAMLDSLIDCDSCNRSVTASTDTTANEAQGGDWTLEYGNIDAAATYFDTSELADWQGQLDTFTVTTLDDEVIADADLSLREAVIAAAATPGADTILLGTGVHTLTITDTVGGLADADDDSTTGDLDIVGDITIMPEPLAGVVEIVAGTGFDSRIFHVLDGGSLTLQNIDRVGDASTSLDGAGIWTRGALSIINSTISNNASDGDGGGIFVDSVRVGVSITDSVISDNSAAGDGGGIYRQSASPSGASATVLILRSELVSNEATSAGSVGGAIFSGANTGAGIPDLSDPRNVQIRDSLLSGNAAMASGKGNAIFNYGRLAIENSTLVDNVAPVAGSQIRTEYLSGVPGFSTSTPIVELGHVTMQVTDDLTEQAWGGTINAAFTAQHTIFDSKGAADQFDGSDGFFVMGGDITTWDPFDPVPGNSHNLFNKAAASGTYISEIPTVSGDLTGDPILGALADNGGATRTLALQAGSPAIDAGDPTLVGALPSNTFAGPIALDQRGEQPFGRVLGAAPDIGAFEVPVGEIRGFIWNDSNGDGLQTGGEAGIGSIELALFDSSDSFVASTSTNSSGVYVFDASSLGLTDGFTGYIEVYVSDPDMAGRLPTLRDANLGAFDGIDSDLVGVDVLGIRAANQGRSATFTYAADTPVILDGGFHRVTDVEGFVFIDRGTLGGAREVGTDLPYPGLIVRFRDSRPLGATTVVETVTDANGFYQFSNVFVPDVSTPGSERSVIGVPADFFDSFGWFDHGISWTELGAGVAAGGVQSDLGLAGEGAVKGEVIFDLDGDGLIGAGDSGITGVQIDVLYAGLNGTLGDTDDVSYGSVFTDGAGQFSLSNIVDGQYRFTVDTTTLGVATTPTFDTDEAVNGLLNQVEFDVLGSPAPADPPDVQFLYTGVGITGRVALDSQPDGLSSGDPGINGVTVNLFTAGVDGVLRTGDDVLADTQVTAGDGDYAFGGLSAGSYLVAVDETGLTAINNIPTGDPDGVITRHTAIATVTDTVVTDFDFVYPGVGSGNFSISGFVVHDVNGDGGQDFGELGLDGVTVQATWLGLDGAVGGGDDVALAPTVTGSTALVGEYRFDGLFDGVFQITVDASTVPLLNPNPTNDADEPAAGTPNQAIVVSSDNPDGVDFLYTEVLPSLSGLVIYDIDESGSITPGDFGAAFVPVTATWFGQDDTLGTADDVVYGPLFTTSTGLYEFAALPPGQYRIAVDTFGGGLSTAFPTFDPDGIGTPDFADVTLAAQGNLDGVDFGYALPPPSVPVPGAIWLDNNPEDAVFQFADEMGLGGITIIANGTGPDGLFGTGDDVTLMTTSDPGGFFQFDSVTDGDYRVTYVAAGAAAGTALNPDAINYSSVGGGVVLFSIDFDTEQGLEPFVELPVIEREEEFVFTPEPWELPPWEPERQIFPKINLDNPDTYIDWDYLDQDTPYDRVADFFAEEAQSLREYLDLTEDLSQKPIRDEASRSQYDFRALSDFFNFLERRGFNFRGLNSFKRWRVDVPDNI